MLDYRPAVLEHGGYGAGPAAQIIDDMWRIERIQRNASKQIQRRPDTLVAKPEILSRIPRGHIFIFIDPRISP